MAAARVVVMVKTRNGWVCVAERPAKPVETKARPLKAAPHVTLWREPPLRLH